MVVDSTVAAVLLDKAIGENLHCIFVNNGLLRKNEFESVLDQYEGMGLNVKGVDASQRFLDALKGESDPEKKRKIIGRVFIEVFDDESHLLTDVKWLAQGTIYPDVIEVCLGKWRSVGHYKIAPQRWWLARFYEIKSSGAFAHDFQR